MRFAILFSLLLIQNLKHFYYKVFLFLSENKQWALAGRSHSRALKEPVKQEMDWEQNQRGRVCCIKYLFTPFPTVTVCGAPVLPCARLFMSSS